MLVDGRVSPDFLVIGAQRAGTSWLWTMLKQHPGTSLPKKKEIHFFGSAELYRKGVEWYLDHFKLLDPGKVIGEASTTYFYDYIPFWHNEARQIEHDTSLPCLPALVTRELPAVKILVVLRDPVARAVSAYKFWMRRVKDVSPFLGLKQTALRYPKLRILEYGYYAKYLRLWRQYVAPERIRVLLFEEDVVKDPRRTVREVYAFLGLDPGFSPERLERAVHRSWTWTRILFGYVTRPLSPRLGKSILGAWVDKLDVLGHLAVRRADIEFLRSAYLPEKPELERLLDRPLNSWTYGEP